MQSGGVLSLEEPLCLQLKGGYFLVLYSSSFYESFNNFVYAVAYDMVSRFFTSPAIFFQMTYKFLM